MVDVLEYKCPACGGNMEFDSNSQKMKCPYCDTEIALEEFEAQKKEWQKDETQGLKIYACSSCGGEVVADENTGATSCPFCGKPVVLKGQFEGNLRPDYIIPFKKDIKDAKNAYTEHLKGKPFLPEVFGKKNHIDEIKGIYVPFWLFDVDAKADIEYRAENVRVWREGNTEYTETRYYDVRRKGTIGFDKVPADGSQKMDDILMQSIEPFDFSEAVEFQPAYLSGYLADRYDVNAEECESQVKKRITESVEAEFRNSVQGYGMVSEKGKTIDLSGLTYKYVLYPVWILGTTWENQRFIFAMNGQTGKFSGDLPMDTHAFWKFVVKWGAIIGAAASILSLVFV